MEYHDGTTSQGAGASAGDPLGEFCNASGPQVLVARNSTCELLLERCIKYGDVDIVCVIDADQQNLSLLARHTLLLTRNESHQVQNPKTHYTIFSRLDVSRCLQDRSGARTVASILKLSVDLSRGVV